MHLVHLGGIVQVERMARVVRVGPILGHLLTLVQSLQFERYFGAPMTDGDHPRLDTG